MTLPELLTQGWTLEFSASGSHIFPVLCRASRVIEQLRPDLHRRALGSAAGIDPTQALTRALALATTNESETIQTFTTTVYAHREAAVNLMSLLGLNAPAPPPAETQRPRRL